MFFREFQIGLFVKFLWLGLVFGIVAVLAKLIVKLTRKNVFITNIVCFLYWLGFGLFYFFMCCKFYEFSFCWFGLFAMLLGIAIIKISIEFFFDYFVRFIYNEITNKKRSKENGKLQAN